MSLPTRMRALVKAVDGPGLEMHEIDVPRCGPTDILVKVLRTGICGTDLHIWRWDDWAR